MLGKSHAQICRIKRVETPGKGALQFFEAERDIPLEIKRIYYITEAAEGVNRGGHAHKQLRQFLFCPYGEILLTIDDGVNRQDILMNSPCTGVLILPCVWRDIKWQCDGSVLCVAASDYYEEGDYIRDYDEFLRYVGSNKQ